MSLSFSAVNVKLPLVMVFVISSQVFLSFVTWLYVTVLLSLLKILKRSKHLLPSIHFASNSSYKSAILLGGLICLSFKDILLKRLVGSFDYFGNRRSFKKCQTSAGFSIAEESFDRELDSAILLLTMTHIASSKRSFFRPPGHICLCMGQKCITLICLTVDVNTFDATICFHAICLWPAVRKKHFEHAQKGLLYGPAVSNITLLSS